MVTHIVAWNFKDEVKQEDRALLLENMKKNLEGLVGQVPGLISVVFYTEPLECSNRDMRLVTKHEKSEDIALYAKHPAHVHVADTFVRLYTKIVHVLTYSRTPVFLQNSGLFR